MADDQQILLDPERVLAAHRARTRRHLVAQAHREADLLDEIANLEAYAAQLSAQPSHQPTPHDPTT